MVSQVGFNGFSHSYWYTPGADTATRPLIQNTNLGTLQQDTVEISGKQKKKINSKKVLIGIGIAAAIGGIIYCVATGKFNNAKQLAEHINFKPAETMEDAVKFAREHLGVKLELGQDLHMANHINESLVEISNAMHGKSAMPKIIRYGEAIGADGTKGAMSATRDIIELGKEQKDLAAILQSKNCSLKEHIAQALRSVGETSKETINQVNNVMLGPIYHEMGHVNHAAVCSDYGRMWSLSELKALGSTDTRLTEEFLRDVKDNKILQEFFGGSEKYAFSSPAEYVAEVFRSRFVRDFERFPTIPEEVQRIYYKYGGPRLDF